jgi:hypothetical protein
MGSCVLRETIRKGRPRFAQRVSLSIYHLSGRSVHKFALSCAGCPPFVVWHGNDAQEELHGR